MPPAFETFAAGLALSLSLIMAIGPQNAHLLRAGIARQHLALAVAVCAVSDVLLIALGVGATASLGDLPPWALGLLLAGGAAFLLQYSAQALRRCLRPALQPAAAAATHQSPAVAGTTRRTAFAQVMAFTWLNPHAWLDTAVLIGTASLAHEPPANWLFGAGAATGSVMWFVLWGGACALAGRRLQGPKVARTLDGAVALLCAFAALSLIRPLADLLA